MGYGDLPNGCPSIRIRQISLRWNNIFSASKGGTASRAEIAEKLLRNLEGYEHYYSKIYQSPFHLNCNEQST